MTVLTALRLSNRGHDMKLIRKKLTEIEQFNIKFPRKTRTQKELTISANGIGEIISIETGDQNIIKWAKANLPNLKET